MSATHGITGTRCHPNVSPSLETVTVIPPVPPQASAATTPLYVSPLNVIQMK
jgi:hypothetical protein